jgi:hypothetical protein
VEFDVGLAGEHPADRFADDRLIVHEQDSERRRRRHGCHARVFGLDVIVPAATDPQHGGKLGGPAKPAGG